MLALVLALMVTLAGCAGSADRTPSLTPLPIAPSDAPSAAPEVTLAAVASPVTGVVVSVDSAGLADVRGFALRTADGVVVDLAIGRLENGDEFPPGHLAEHMATVDPVRVFFRNEDGRLVVYRIEDAG